MKLYNKKGLIRGLGLTLLGIIFLLGDIFCFDEIEINIIWSITLIVIGLADSLRCFSKTKAEEDIIADTDERNILMKLTSKARSLDIVETCCLIATILFAIIFKKTNDMIYVGAILTAGFGFIFIMLVKFVVGIYYDHKK